MKKICIFLGFLTTSTLMHASLQNFIVAKKVVGVGVQGPFLRGGARSLEITDVTKPTVGPQNNSHISPAVARILFGNKTNIDDNSAPCIKDKTCTRGMIVVESVFGGIILTAIGVTVTSRLCKLPCLGTELIMQEELEITDLDVDLK